MKFDICKSNGIVVVSILLLPTLFGFVLGLSFSSIGSFAAEPSSSRAIQVWRTVEPGMTTDEVIAIVGEPKARTDVGQDHPSGAASCAPSEYLENHGSLMYLYGPLPQVVFIFFDDDERVTFVGNAPT